MLTEQIDAYVFLLNFENDRTLQDYEVNCRKSDS